MASFVAEPIFHIGSFPFTNTLLDTLIIDALVIFGALKLKEHIAIIPNGFQNAFELVTEGFYNITESISPRHAARIFPYFMTFFLFILLTNWSGLIPGFGTIGFYRGKEFVPLLRAATSDINMTLGLAIVSAATTHALSINILGIKEYLSRYFSLNPIYLFVGILELVGEITKVISLTFRLFGNIYAGETVLTTVSGLITIKLPIFNNALLPISSFILPLPFLALEIIVGLVQALVFSMLTMSFMAILTTSHHEEEAGANPSVHNEEEGGPSPSEIRQLTEKGGESHEH